MSNKDTRVVNIGRVKIGGGNPVAIQSMTNTPTEDAKATIKQILDLEAAGCEIIRCTVPTMEAAKAISEIKKNIHIPLVADIHFDYRLAIAAMENGVDKVRINPGNIGSIDKVRAVVEKAKEYKVPIRIGVNSGSLDQETLKKYGRVTAEALVESAFKEISVLESLDFH
ncbi:MAG TPA: 4-hydroxy-3-methylbut-2-en-1-yl diphosphate synthase, partial [Lachnospiraceae bacterium]|nr:4-hydroxy-3-methylbut-2-en-1-yl diphosphate synthase [Lachnospiraceae bacterium]